eukprot:UN06311
MHGGLLAFLVDMTCVSAVRVANVRKQKMRGTQDLRITYLKPATGKYMLATAKVIKMGKTIAVVSVDIRNDSGDLVAIGEVLT